MASTSDTAWHATRAAEIAAAEARGFFRGRLGVEFKADAIRCLKRGRMIDPSNKSIAQMLREIGMRQGPVIRFLPRGHRLNVWLGQARHRVRSRSAAAA